MFQVLAHRVQRPKESGVASGRERYPKTLLNHRFSPLDDTAIGNHDAQGSGIHRFARACRTTRHTFQDARRPRALGEVHRNPFLPV